MRYLYAAGIITFLVGCSAMPQTSSSGRAHRMADKVVYQAVTYANQTVPGPKVIVLPGHIKSTHATFTQKISANNIADFAEIELLRANFKLLERNDLGPLLEEIRLAANLGDAEGLKKFRRGKFKTTRWFVQFDILKAEKVVQTGMGFDGRALGAILGRATKNSAVQSFVGSVKAADAAGIWIVGLRYKVLDATTSEQVTTGYFEEKMEVGANAVSILGVSHNEMGGVTLDTMVQRLVQKAVSDLDSMKRDAPKATHEVVAEAVPMPNQPVPVQPQSTSEPIQAIDPFEMAKSFQNALNELGYDCGVVDGLLGKNTRRAIVEFQTRYDLPLSGQFDHATAALLDQLMGERQAGN